MKSRRLGRPGQRIVIRVAFQPLACRAQFGDVFGDSQDEFRNAVVIQQRNNDGTQLPRRAIPCDEREGGLDGRRVVGRWSPNGIHGGIKVQAARLRQRRVDDVVLGSSQ